MAADLGPRARRAARHEIHLLGRQLSGARPARRAALGRAAGCRREEEDVRAAGHGRDRLPASRQPAGPLCTDGGTRRRVDPRRGARPAGLEARRRRRPRRPLRHRGRSGPLRGGAARRRQPRRGPRAGARVARGDDAVVADPPGAAPAGSAGTSGVRCRATAATCSRRRPTATAGSPARRSGSTRRSTSTSSSSRAGSTPTARGTSTRSSRGSRRPRWRRSSSRR